MMAGERRNGNLLVHLGPQLQAYPEELIRQRCNHEGHTEYLIRWSICSLDEKVGENGTTASTESKAEHILMWMSAEEVYANCPTLLGKRKPEGQWMKEEATPSAFPAHVPLDQEALQDMKNDVRTLVQRATKQMTQSSGPESSILNTIHVLSAYASIGSLAGVFRETGALDLLMKMLCNEEKQIRRSAGKMLRALASHDAGSRAYVLLSLSQQDGIEHHMDFDSRYTLLELFAETTSSEEHCISFEGILLPQIPGKVLFSLVKRYLCVTSLMDNLNSSSEQGARRQDSAAASMHVTERSRVLVEFEFSMAMANLISELLRVLGWERVPRVEQGESRGTRSVIQPKAQDISGPHITSNGFKTRSDFSSRSSYARYVQENLKPGMSVRLLEEYEQVSRGEEGEYRRSNDGSPPVQVYWRSLARTYWVHWHMLELTSSYKRVEKETLQKACGLMEKLNVSPVSQVFYCRPHGSSYSLPYLMERVMEDSGTLSQSEWWELLFFIKKLEPQEQQEVNRIIRQDLEEQLSELTEEALIQLSVPVELAQKVLQFLNQHCQGFTLTDLHNSHIYIRYISQGGPEQDCLNGVMTSADYTGLGSPLSGVSKKPKKEAPAADNFPLPPPTAEKTDLELFQELFKAQGFQLPEVGEETTKDISVSFDFKDVDLLKLVSSLKESSLSKEIILALERCICEETALLDSETSNLMKDRDTFLMLLRNLEQLRMEKAVQMGVLRILTKLLDNYQDDLLPWHESIEPCLSSMTAHSNDRELVQEFICFLHRLATSNKDCAVVMCRLGMKEALTKALDKHSSNLLLVTELRDLVTDCEKYASLYKQMTTSILAGCIQMVLGQIEEHRRSHQSINIPFFDIFLRNLCQGSSMEVKEDKCWEKVEVSSNPHRANKLTDRNPKTYWESNGSTGSHYINIYMHRGVVIRQLFLLVASEDSSYMPARIIVLGGENSSSIKTELNTVNVLASANRVILIENLTRFWPIIQIRIKRCQQGGIDTRVRGIEVLGPKPTFWPVFKEQLCRRTYLFYTTRAHAWCQEISQDRVQLLQLFNKLNSALRHEQVFADHFLPDDEAAQALGRTCWEALISPLVQSITTPDASSLSPLCWLLTEYLENLELPRCTKCQAAIFNSRVRRLSHLLVHVDTSRPETKELKPPTKSNGKNEKEKVIVAASVKEQGSKLSSMTGITRCWQDVVQQQVKKFLESAWNTSDFVERYRNIYLRLKNAMEELFGQQTAFVMALRHGFSGALLQLSFLTAMHVSEQFARYIDQRIQESWMDSSNRETLRQLQQFLEPMLFLSGLELANTFEHFYRYYLGDRLLTQGKIWLESAVIDKIGLCFPNRFPQQMLKNVSESEELQQEFHLFQLQQLDKRLLDAEKLDMTDDQMDDQIIEDHALRLQKESEVKVLVLSPGCWTISHLCHMDDPRKYFPASLYSYLGKFSDFYTESQSMCGLEHAKPRRLHWTWLGHAEVLYGAVTLHVSTLQMFILLNFNSQQEVSVETLLLSTGLSPVLLGHALKPLTVQGGILTQSDEDRGVLRLNEGWRSGEAAQQSQMWLLPNQTYLNVEEDEGNTLERKRNIICCLLIQIMKKEKEMHIDNLVFQVVDACQKWESGSALKFLSFCCSHTDVLSCIMHLINQGYVRRHEDSPHILEYISKEPTTPHKGQAQIFFKTSEKRNRVDKSKASLLSVDSFGGGTEQGILEAMLLPMGRTMSQDEVALLMAQTVKQVQELLNESLDTAQHLLIHCKWNVDLVIQRFTEEAEQLLIEAGLRVLEPQPPQSALTTCPVCVSQISQGDSPPSLCCKHYCCKSCWNEYLTTRIEQNLVLSCTCPIADCPAQPTADFIRTIISAREIIEKYEKALLRGYVECCSNLTWCTNPQGCDQILCKEGLGNAEACSKCSWMSCFSCSFPEAHYPASCSHMSQWMDDGGFYEGMTKEAQSKHLAKLISKRCPSCQAQIEKNEGCLHMTCTKCNHGFCWRCLKPWKPTHKDYYNCAAMVSKAARQEKRFYDYNERCTFHHLAREFAMNLKKRVCSISAVNDLRSLTFVVDACVVLEQARKVMAYSCVYSYYNQDTEKMDVIEQQTESLELHTSALEILLDEILLHCEDLASCIRLLKVEHFNTGVELLRRIQERLVAILHHSTQDFRIGFQFRSDLDIRGIKLSNVPATDPAFGFKDLKCDGGSDSPDTDEGDEGKDAEDVEYVPDWHEDYDDEDIDDDNFSYDDESENLEQDDFFFDDDDDGEAYE